MDMNWIGLARSIQPELMGFCGALLLIALALVASRVAVSRSSMLIRDKQRVNRSVGFIALGLALLFIIVMVWHVGTVMSSSRLSRHDIDRLPVYKQMNRFIK